MTRTGIFVGFTPDRPADRSFDLWRLIVSASQRQADRSGDIQRWVACLQEVTNLLLAQVDAFPALADPERCTDAVVDAMLADLGNPFTWPELALSAAARRTLLRTLVQIYRYAGTAVGIEATILLLLGVPCQVLPHTRTGWVLGRDSLGGGTIARLLTAGVAPFDFTAVAAPWTGTFAVDAGIGQVVTVTAADFADPSAATAPEVAAAIAAQCTGLGTYCVADGSPAIVDGGAGPFNFSIPGRLLLTVGSTLYDRVLHPADFPDPAVVPLAWALPVLQTVAPGVLDALATTGGVLRLRTRATGAAATLTVVNDPANTGAVALGLSLGATAAGVEGQRVGCYSLTAGPGARIAMTTPGSALDAVCGWWPYYAAGTGGCVLAPSEARTRYTFDIETATPVDAATAALIRRIAHTLRGAHEHLGAVRTAPALPWPPYWVLGVDALNAGTLLGP